MRTHLLRIFSLSLLLMFCAAGPALALDEAREQIGEYGYIDWVNMEIRATGMGVAGPKAMNHAHARILAKGAAKVVAQRNLLEVVKGVHIDSATTVQNYMVQDDTIISRVKGVLKGATVENYVFDADNACTATISIRLTGDLSRAILQRLPQTDTARTEHPGVNEKIARLEQRIAALEERINSLQHIKYEQDELSRLFIQLVTMLSENQHASLHQAAFADSSQIKQLETNQQAILRNLTTLSARISRLEQKNTGQPQTQESSSTTANQAGYTGLIIDARNVGFRPCLRPKIFGKSKLIYPGPYVDRHTAIRQGYVRFYRNIRQAQQSSRAGTLPYTIKAATTHKGLKRTLILPDDAATELLAIIKAHSSFMSRCKVIVVF